MRSTECPSSYIMLAYNQSDCHTRQTACDQGDTQPYTETVARQPATLITPSHRHHVNIACSDITSLSQSVSQWNA